MNCNEIENRLPVYLDALLSPEEEKIITEHLALCPRCSRAFADLKATEEILHGLDEVESPPFFEQRIMARVREEAGRKRSFLRRLFYPLHIKVPVQALATILVAVLAFHIYQTNEPEMKQAVPHPLPVTGQATDRVAAESPAATVPPYVAAPIERKSASNPSEKEEQGFAAPPSKSSDTEKEITASVAPAPKEPPAVVESAAPPTGKAERESYATGAQTLSKAQQGTAKRDADHALESSPPERKQKMMAADVGATPGESSKAVYASATSKMTARTPVKRSAVELTIQVGNPENAIQEVEAYIDQVNARIIEQGRRDGDEFLKVEIPARDLAVFLDGLKAIGRVNVETQPPAFPDEDVILNIKIVGRP